MVTIRLVTESDIPTIKSWWEAAKMPGFTANYLPKDSAYLAMYDSIPAASLSLYKTNIKEYAYLECYIANPDFSKEKRRKASEYLLQYIEGQAEALGYNKLVCLTHIDALKSRYIELGYRPSLNNVTTFVKEL